MRRRLDKEGKVRLIVHRLMSIVFHHHNNHLFLTFMIILLWSLFEEKNSQIFRRSNRRVRKKKYSGQQEILYFSLCSSSNRLVWVFFTTHECWLVMGVFLQQLTRKGQRLTKGSAMISASLPQKRSSCAQISASNAMWKRMLLKVPIETHKSGKHIAHHAERAMTDKDVIIAC